MTIPFAFILIISYLIGAIPTGVLLTRIAGTQDIRKAGSGNIGATNVYRVAGRSLGIMTLLGDILKGALPVLYALKSGGFGDLQVALVAVAAFVGHCYPVYLKFKGGKGVATALGIFLVLSPLSVLCALGIFFIVLWKWRYISLSSIMAAAAITPLIYFFEDSVPLLAGACFISTIVIFRHRTNIERIKAGTENRFRA